MTKDRKLSGELRSRAEDRLGAGRSKEAEAEADAQCMLHELEVHQAELEIQNEELRSARGETEAALARYTELFDFAPIGYTTLSADGVVREMNHAGARLLGKVRSRVVGMPFAGFVASRDVDAFRTLLLRATAEGEVPSCELELRFGERSAHVRLTATTVARGDRTVLLAFEDITERLAREEQLARTEQALREADRRKDEFLAMLSHELRNPLGPIRSSLFVLDHVEPASRRAHEAREIIDRQVAHLTRLVDDLLDVTRITRGKIELHREGVELNELVRRTLGDHRVSFAARGIRLEVRLEPGPFWLSADPARLIQIVSNVLSNAEKFTPRAGTITVSVEARGAGVALSVRDTGVGIAPDLIGSLFQPFAQAPQTLERSRGGLGLGLAMVKGLVELHGGTVQIASEGADRGTEVTVLLPLVAAPARRPRAVDGAAGPSRRVLLIEDNVDAAAALGEALRLMGHEVRVVHRGPAGLDVARGFEPEVVVCDLGLPQMDGYAVAQAFRADPALREMNLIALSGYARAEDQQRAAAAGFDHHVPKPPDLQRLYRLISEATPRASSPAPHPAASASDHAAASGEDSPPAAYELPPSRRSSGPAPLARRG